MGDRSLEHPPFIYLTGVTLTVVVELDDGRPNDVTAHIRAPRER